MTVNLDSKTLYNTIVGFKDLCVVFFRNVIPGVSYLIFHFKYMGSSLYIIIQ